MLWQLWHLACTSRLTGWRRAPGVFAKLLLSNGQRTPPAATSGPDAEEAVPTGPPPAEAAGKRATGGIARKPASPQQLVLAEKRHEGGVPIGRYLGYYRVMGQPCFTATMLALFPASELLGIIQDWWLAQWANQALGVGTSDASYLAVFSLLAVLSSLMILVRSLMYARFVCTAATSLHNAALSRILFVPLLFFERNPVGRILVRSHLFAQTVLFAQIVWLWIHFVLFLNLYRTASLQTRTTAIHSCRWPTRSSF